MANFINRLNLFTTININQIIISRSLRIKSSRYLNDKTKDLKSEDSKTTKKPAIKLVYKNTFISMDKNKKPIANISGQNLKAKETEIKAENKTPEKESHDKVETKLAEIKVETKLAETKVETKLVETKAKSTTREQYQDLLNLAKPKPAIPKTVDKNNELKTEVFKIAKLLKEEKTAEKIAIELLEPLVKKKTGSKIYQNAW
jgi:hypothetical protein